MIEALAALNRGGQHCLPVLARAGGVEVVPLARRNHQQVQRFATGRISSHLDRLDGVDHFIQIESNVIDATEVEYVSGINPTKRSGVTTEEVALIGRRLDGIDHDFSKLVIRCQRQDDVGRHVVATGTSQVSKADLIQQATVVAI